MDAGTDADAVSAVGVGAVKPVVDLRTRIVGADEDAMRVESGVGAGARDLELVVEAKIAEVRVNAHGGGGGLRCDCCTPKGAKDEQCNCAMRGYDCRL